MPLDPQARAYLDQAASLNAPPAHLLTPELARQGMIAAQLAMSGTPEPIASLENRLIQGPTGELPVRIYTPAGNRPFPVLVYAHGGGWVVGNLDTHDGICRSLANGAGCVVVSVEYRLAPEYPFPAAPQDCYAATAWVAKHATEINGDPARIAIGGDSAGGNLAAVVALMARERGGPQVAFQLLIYPATDFRMDTPSVEENGEGYYLTKADMVWYRNHYLQAQDEERNPLASPLLAADLRGLPPALIVTAEYDPLRDEGERYGQRLQEAGVPVTISRYNGVIHGFIRMAPIFDQGKHGLAECSQALRAAFIKQ